MNVSFVIIAYNEERNIANAINSIIGQKNLNDYEIIVVNDGSKDNTANEVKKISDNNKNVKLIDLRENKGRDNARKTGVSHAKGNYVAFIDADIILPTNWLLTCLEEIKNYDAVGGIAVPDGDSTYIYNKFNLKPKVKEPTTELTGNNCFYKKELLKHIEFDPKAKDGEDFDINERLKKEGYKLKTINIVVEHRELKDFKKTFKWLYQSGKGSMRLLFKYKRIRMPDIAFSGFLFLLLFNLLEIIFLLSIYSIILTFMYILLTSFMHIKSKFIFEGKTVIKYLLAIIYNYPFMLAYFIGRIMWVFKR